MEHVQKLQSTAPREESSASASDLAALVAGHTEFAVWMHHQGVAQVGAGENFLFSPLSISTAFAMLWPGAVGETADEIATMLSYALDAEAFHPAANALDRALAARNDYVPRADEGDAPILEIVNDIWGLDGYPYVDAWLDLLARHYGAGLWIVDFPQAFEEARQEINKYIEHRTRGLIPDLLPEGSVNELTRLVLTNAIYFKGAWQFPFMAELTEDEAFTALDGTVTQVPMMRTGLRTEHATVDGAEALELGYVGGDLSMVLIVPDAGTFEAFEAGLSGESLTALLGALAPNQGQVRMPRFAFNAELELASIFRDAGFTAPFTEGVADFSGLSETALAEGLHVTGAFHKARIIVDEVGTEAAAATGLVAGATSAPENPFDVRLDRPFLFVIRDRPTGAVLFMGRVVDATAAQE